MTVHNQGFKLRETVNNIEKWYSYSSAKSIIDDAMLCETIGEHNVNNSDKIIMAKEHSDVNW